MPINPEERKRVDALNLKFSEFGYNPQNELKFKWAHTTELYYFVLSLKPESEWETFGSLLVPTHGFQRYTWAGPLGECWHLSYWQKPVSYAEWVASGREDFPWPQHGEYLCVENVRAIGTEPTEKETLAAVDGIRYSLQLLGPTHNFDQKGDYPMLREHIEEQKRKREAHDEYIKNQVAEDFDEHMPAFWKEPGSNSWGVSLPRPESQIKREGGTPMPSVVTEP